MNNCIGKKVRAMYFSADNIKGMEGDYFLMIWISYVVKVQDQVEV